nr:hypothetical protein [Pandoravirus massiliensis]
MSYDNNNRGIDRRDDNNQLNCSDRCVRGCTPLPAIVEADGTRHWYMHGMRVEAPLTLRPPHNIDRQRARADSSLAGSFSLLSRWCTAPFASLST